MRRKRSRGFLFVQKTVYDASKALWVSPVKATRLRCFHLPHLKLLDKLPLRRVSHLVLVEALA